MIIEKNGEAYFKASGSDYARPMESYRRKNTTRMFVDGKYIPRGHPDHRPGSFRDWIDALGDDRTLYSDADALYGALRSGFVYVITNPAWPGWTKVGHSRDPLRRLDSYQTGAPERDYALHGYCYFTDRVDAEKEIHSRLSMLDPIPSGEWFGVSPPNCLAIVREVAEEWE